MSQILLDMISSGILAVGAVVSFGIFSLRRNRLKSKKQLGPERLWLLSTIGLLYLSADEFFDLHSQYDNWMHGIMGWNETAITDRIDDVIIGLYVVGAMIVMFAYRRELWEAAGHRQTIRLLTMGFVLAGVHVFCDLLSNRNDVWHLLFQESNANFAYRWTSWSEQSSEIGSEILLLGALGLILKQCRLERIAR